MSTAIHKVAEIASARGASAVFKRLTFIAEAEPGLRQLREYRNPRNCIAIEEDFDANATISEKSELLLAMIPTEAAAETKKVRDTWMSSGDVGPITFTACGLKIEWRPGRAIVQGPPAGFDAAAKALADFTFYEGELRALEREIESREPQAQLDASYALRIRHRDRKHWQRFAELIEHFYRMRLSYARLEPQLTIPSSDLPRDAKQLMTRLCEEANVEDRLEAFSNRLEACEDLYEGATDRIAEYKWYFGGQWLEITIVGLLVLEVVLLGFDMYLRHFK
ncbi:MAG TPA: hypothetical protein VMA09_13990 [Candidatus Binataceae bacterium]|nr:hypothetical protein [Candidatus Binataceae bacterium]